MPTLPYALWPLLTLAMVVLWMAAMVDISGHGNRGTFTSARSMCMAAVSVVVVLAVALIDSVFTGQRFEAASGPGSDSVQAAGQGEAYVFSLGLQRTPEVTPARPTVTK